MVRNSFQSQATLFRTLVEVFLLLSGLQSRGHFGAIHSLAEVALIVTCVTWPVLIEDRWSHLVLKSSLIIQKLVFSAFHHFSQAHIYNIVIILKNANEWPVLLYSHQPNTRNLQRLRRGWNLKPFSGNDLRSSSVCKPIFHSRHVLIKSLSPFYLYSLLTLLALFSSQTKFTD